MPHDLVELPKAHLHLHLTGAMRHSTMVELAQTHGISLPPALTEEWPPQLSTADERGWFRFQRLYDVARSVLRTPDDLYRLGREVREGGAGGRHRDRNHHRGQQTPASDVRADDRPAGGAVRRAGRCRVRPLQR